MDYNTQNGNYYLTDKTVHNRQPPSRSLHNPPPIPILKSAFAGSAPINFTQAASHVSSWLNIRLRIITWPTVIWLSYISTSVAQRISIKSWTHVYYGNYKDQRAQTFLSEISLSISCSIKVKNKLIMTMLSLVTPLHLSQRQDKVDSQYSSETITGKYSK